MTELLEHLAVGADCHEPHEDCNGFFDGHWHRKTNRLRDEVEFQLKLEAITP